MQIGSFGIPNCLPNAEAVPAWQIIYTADDLPEDQGFPFLPGFSSGCTHREIHTGGIYHYQSTVSGGCMQQAKWNADHVTGYTVEARIKVFSIQTVPGIPIPFNGISVFAEAVDRAAILVLGTDRIREFFTDATFFMDTTDTFHDYRVVAQGSSFTIYVDGISKLTGTMSSFIDRHSLLFGDGTGGESGDAEWDCVAYTTAGAFSPAQLASPSCGTPNCTEPPSGMVSWWDGDAVIGTTAMDIQDDNDGTLMNGAATATGKVGNAFSFDGVDDYVDIPENAGLNLAHATIDMWIKPVMASSDLTGRHFIDKRMLGNPSTGEYTGYVRGNGDIDFIFDTSGADPFFDGSPGLIPMNVWSHVAFTWDGSTLNVYRNGIVIGTAPGSGTIVNNAESIKLGQRVDLDSIHSFNGVIDEVEIYDRALLQSEIQSIVNAGSAGKCKEFFDVEKFYTETDVNWNPNIDNDGDGLINEDPVNGINDDGDALVDEDDVDEIKFGTNLPTDSGKFLLQAVVKKDGTVSNYNPGQYYAVTKVTVKQDLDNLWIEELFGDCTDRDDGPNLSIVNPNKVPGGAAVVVVDPLGAVTDRSDELAASGALFLTDTNGTPNDGSDDNGITDNAELHLEESIPKDSMVYLYVKFAPGLKGQPLPSDPDNMCHNEEIVSTMIDDNTIEEIAEADLIVKAK